MGLPSRVAEPVLRDRYLDAALRILSLPAGESRRLIPTRDSIDLDLARRVFLRVAEVGEGIARLRGFRFDPAPLPTYDPPVLPMQELLDALPPTPAGTAYLAGLGRVKARALGALEAWESGRPGAADEVVAAARAIEEFQEERIRAAGPILYIRRPFVGRINAVDPYNWPRGGPSGIALFDPARPDARPRPVYDDPEGGIYDMSLSFDARTVLFSALRKGVPGGWQIHEVGADGRGLRQITRETRPDSGRPLGYGGFHHPNPSVDNNVSPIELPSGELMFVSSRAGNVLVCQPGRAAALYVCDRDGGRVRRVSANTLSDHSPAVMEDGRVMFTRWDYGVDKGVFQRHGVWAMAPGGDRLELLFGNTIYDPAAFWQAKPVPGRPEIVSTFGGHHAGPYGVPGLVWGGLGIEAPRGAGYRFLAPEAPTYFDGDFQEGYVDPFPLNEHEFLVAYGGGGGRKHRLYLMDDRGNRACIWEEESLGCYSPVPFRPRPRPPVVASMARPAEFVPIDPVEANRRPDGREGILLVTDVGRGLEGRVERGEVAAIQILEQVPKTRPHTGGYAWNVSPTIGRGTFYVRRLIGTVPVERDGSALFAAPALRDISFNLLDARGRVIQKMGSTTQIMPEEIQGCAGCHESRSSAPVRPGAVPLALRRAPSSPRRPDWGTDGIIDYIRVVQPVWDRHCVSCHSGPRPSAGLDLSGDRTRLFCMSYDMLVDRGLVHHVPMNGADHDLTTPRANGSLASRLLPHLEGHGLGPDDLERVHTWIDANVPYYGTYLYTDGSVNGARDRWYAARPDGWFRSGFAPVFDRRCAGCHQRSVDISDAWLGRRSVTVTSRVWTDTTLMDQGLQIEPAVAPYGPEHRINLTHPEWSRVLMAPLAPAAGGLGLCREADGRPVFADGDDSDFRAMLGALRTGAEMLAAHPRVDMLPR